VSTASLERQLTALARLPERGTLEGAKTVAKIAREVGSQVGPVSLGKRGRRAKLTAVYRVKRKGLRDAEVTVWGRPTGPWVWVTSGTGGHVIPKQRGGKARTTRYLKGDRYSHPYGKAVHHPGATGRGAWKRVVLRSQRDVVKVFEDQARAVMRG
jgi:hypothetical protein